MVACILMMCPVICSAASSLYEYSAVEVIDYPNEMTVEEVLQIVVEEAKKEVEANPDKEYYVQSKPKPADKVTPVISTPAPYVKPSAPVKRDPSSSLLTYYFGAK